METLLIILAFFVLGSVALQMLEVGKRIASVVLVLVLGWGVWNYVGPVVIDENATLGDTLIAWNTQLKEKVIGDIKKVEEEGGKEFADAVIQNVKESTAFPEEEKHASAPEDKEEHPDPEATTAFDKFVSELKAFFRKLLAQ